MAEKIPLKIEDGKFKQFSATDTIPSNNLPPSFGVAKFAVDLDSAEVTVSRVFAAGKTTFSVNHGLGQDDFNDSGEEISTLEKVVLPVDIVDSNNVNIVINGNVANGIYRFTIIG